MPLIQAVRSTIHARMTEISKIKRLIAFIVNILSLIKLVIVYRIVYYIIPYTNLIVAQIFAFVNKKTKKYEILIKKSV